MLLRLVVYVAPVERARQAARGELQVVLAQPRRDLQVHPRRLVPSAPFAAFHGRPEKWTLAKEIPDEIH